MARTVRDANLDSRTARARLKARGKPYYRAVDRGLHLGYRKGKNGGTWVLRWYVGEQEYRVQRLEGRPDDIDDANGSEVLSFSQAQALARAQYVKLERTAKGLPTKGGLYSVEDALNDYLAWLEQNRKSAADSRTRANALILPALGKIEAAKLSAERIRKWLQVLAGTPARLRTAAGEEQQYRQAPHDDEAVRRRRATANRTLTILKAALNWAWREGKIANDAEWRRVEPFGEADAARVRYLSVKECVRLINASDPDFRELVRAALATGARYGELGRLNVQDYNPDAGTLHIRKSKSGRGRHVALTEEGVALFKQLAAGRAAKAPILVKSGGSRWLPAHQSRPLAEACERAKIDPPADFHCLRHTFASLAVMAGAPLIVVAKTLGHADTRMVEKHYGHLAPSYVADAIRAAAPRFGIVNAGQVAELRSAR